MKRILLYTLALLAASACFKEPAVTLRTETTVLQAVISDDEAVTKSILIDNPGLKMENRWTEGDQIGLFGEGASNQAFTINAATLSLDGKKADFQSSSAVPKGELSAYTPYQKEAGRNGNELVVNFPATQHGAMDGGLEHPDPAANFMIGSGNADAGLSFRPVMAILKFGQVFDKDMTLSKVEFRDLSGAPVAGELKITGGSTPKAEITGSQPVLTLEFGEAGLEIPAGTLHPLFLIVPAREYAKGFEIAFIATDGAKTVKTVGTKMGKTLSRGVVYTLGDVSAQNYSPGAKSELNPGAWIVTPELADLMRVISVTTDVLRDVDGEGIRDVSGYYVFRPAMTLLVHDDLPLQPGNWLIFEYGSAQVPDGGIFNVQTVQPMGGGYSQVYITTEANIAAPFQEVTVGEDLFDEEGNEIEGAGVDLDISNHIQDIVDENGQSVPFRVQDGQLLFTEEAMEQLMGISTKASFSRGITSPNLSLTLSEKNISVSLGASLSIDFKAALKFYAGRVDYIHFSAHPVFHFSAGFAVKAELFKVEKEQFLFTMHIAPIPVAPGVFLNTGITFYAKEGVSGDISFSAAVKFDYDMGMFGLSYQDGVGLSVRHAAAEPKKDENFSPNVFGISGSLNAFAALSVRPYFSVSGILGMGVDVDLALGFGISVSGDGPKLALTPGITLTPRFLALGGYFTKKVNQLAVAIEFDPLWERYLVPILETSKICWPIGPTKGMAPFYFKNPDGTWSKTEPAPYAATTTSTMYTHIDGIKYGIASSKPTFDDWKIYLQAVRGFTNMPWKLTWLGLSGASFNYGYDATLDNCVWVQNSIQSVAQYEIMDLPSGQHERLVSEGVVGKPEDFQSGIVYGFRMVCVNKRTHDLYYPLNMGAMVADKKTMMPCAFYWPNTPEGPVWVTTNVGNQLPYNFNEGTPGSEYIPDGYFAGYDY